MISKSSFKFYLIQSFLIVLFRLLALPLTKEAQIGVFEINSLEELGGSKVKLINSAINEYHQLSDFESNMQVGWYGFGKVGISPYLNITNECRDKLLAKNPYAEEVLIYKIFRFRESDPEKEPNNKNLGVYHVYETFFQLFYYRAKNIDKYTKVDVEGVCAEKIALFLMHTLDNETLTTNFKNVQNQCPIKAPVANFMKWYDTLNPNSDFYNSICIGYTYNTLVDTFLKNETKLNYYDTPLDIRKKYFFGNLYLCPDYCTYSGIFSVAGFLLITCHCTDPHYDLLSDPTIVQETQYMQPFDFDEEKFFNTKHDSFFSIGVLTCFMFTFILGMQNNYGCYIILGIAGVIVFSFVDLIIFGKKRILLVFELLYSNNINNNNNSLKNNKNYQNNSKDNILNDKMDIELISSSAKDDLEINNRNNKLNIQNNNLNKKKKSTNIQNKNIININDAQYNNIQNRNKPNNNITNIQNGNIDNKNLIKNNIENIRNNYKYKIEDNKYKEIKLNKKDGYE